MTSRIERFAEALGSRYAVERELATGGTATVFLANDLRYQRRVAVKVFRPEIAEALGHERFVREIAVVAKLNHPHIVPLLDSGEVEELMYYVMPAVEGESLRDRLTREGRLALDEAVRIARDVAVALDYAHGRNIVHRDIKPENILLTAGAAVVADFGIAKMLNHSSGGNSLTRAGIAVGTVAYMSPEQAAAGPVDGRTDEYALACVLFEMLAGRPPFTGKTTRAVVASHFTDPVPDLTAIRPEVAPSMHQVIAKALAKAPDDRYPTVTAFLDELQAARRTASRERIFKKMGFDEASAQLAAEGTTEDAVITPSLVNAARAEARRRQEAAPTLVNASGSAGTPPTREATAGGARSAASLEAREGGGTLGDESPPPRRSDASPAGGAGSSPRPIPLIAVVGAVVVLAVVGWLLLR